MRTSCMLIVFLVVSGAANAQRPTVYDTQILRPAPSPSSGLFGPSSKPTINSGTRYGFGIKPDTYNGMPQRASKPVYPAVPYGGMSPRARRLLYGR